MRTSRLALGLLFLVAWGFTQPAPIQQQLTFTPYHANDIYAAGETVGWTVTPGPTKPTYAYKWTIRQNNSVVLREGKLDLSSGQDKIEITAEGPEMIYVAVEPYANLSAKDAPVQPHPHSPAATQDATTGSMLWALPLHQRKLVSRRRDQMTSTPSGKPNSRCRQISLSMLN